MSDMDITVLELTRERDALLVENQMHRGNWEGMVHFISRSLGVENKTCEEICDAVDALLVENRRLIKCLATANANHEKFERLSYLREDENEKLIVENRELKEGWEGCRKMASDFAFALMDNQNIKPFSDPFLTDLLSYHREQVVELRGRTFSHPPVNSASDDPRGGYDDAETVVSTTDRIAFHRRAVKVLEGLV